MKTIKLLLVMLFSIAVAACGGGGGGGGGSTVTTPGAPTTVTASPGNTSATVSFTAPANNGGAAITGYAVTSSPGNITVTGTTSPILVTGLTNGTAYTFTVVATNSAGNSAASTASNSVTPSATPIAPSAPTSVTATPGNTTATVTFTASASNGGAAITGYTVTSSPAGGTDSNAGTTGLTHTITGLTNGTAYTFTVVATNSVGNSPASTASNSVTPTVATTIPGVPTAVTATAGNASATVSFTAPASNGGAAITGYTVTSSPAGGTDSNAGTTGLTHTITGLSNGTAYTFTVVATNSMGNSPASSASNSVTPVTVPGAPTAVTATAGNGQATVSFTAPASTGGAAITGYTVTSSPAGGTDSNAGTTGLTHTITGLTNNTAYTFTVVATNSAGNSAASTASNSVTPVTGWTVPGVPTAVTATAGNTTATVSFTAPASNGGTAITGYTVTSIPAGGTDSNAGTTGLTHTITGLSNGTAYTFTVVATNSVGNSPASSASNSVTPAVTPVSGTVTGPWVAGVTITVTGGTTTTQTTDTAGNYSFNLAPGSYTLTPSLPGYTFSPINIPVAVPAGSSTAITGNNFVSSSAVTSYSISGTVSYAGAKTGPIYLRVWDTTCSGCGSPRAGTLIATAGTYTIRGLQPGTYSVNAEMDTLNTGVKNANNPTGNSTTVTITTANLNSVSVALADPATPAPVTPTGLGAFPSNGAAFVMWDAMRDTNGAEIATSYKVYWGTDVAATNGTGSPRTVIARDDGMLILSGLTNGALNVKVSALVGATESTISAPVAVTIGNSTAGPNTVSGAVTFPGTATGPMLVGLFSKTTGIYFTTIASPASPQNYSVAGVPAGSYYAFAVIDMNNNGVVDVGDLNNTNSSAPSVTVSGNLTGNNITLSSASATTKVTTDHWSDGTNQSYQLSLRVSDNTKRVASVTLVSGLNVAVPFDLGKGWEFEMWQFLGTTSPTVGDSYVFKVTYSDGTTQNLTSSVTGVLSTSNMATSLAVNPTPSATVPTFTWAAPTTPPTSYFYYLSLWGTGAYWYYPEDNGLPSTTLSALYNVDGMASVPALMAGTPYTWQVKVQDANGNNATRQSTYTP